MRSNVLGDRKFASVPFMFGAKEDEENPSSFGLLFIAEDGTIYHYGFSLKSRAIESEWLIAYYTKRLSMLFERYKDETGKVVFSFGQQFKKTTENGGRFLSFISQEFPDDCLFITEAATRGVIACSEAVSLLSSHDNLGIPVNPGTDVGRLISEIQENIPKRGNQGIN